MKKSTIGLIIVAVLLISGCAQKTGEQKVFVSSDDALDISFAESQPPDRIFGYNPFDIVVLLLNKGEHALLQNEVILTLNDASLLHNNIPVGLQPEFAVVKNAEPLAAVSQAPSGEYLSGGRTGVIWEDISKGTRTITEETKTPIRVEACYPYETSTTARLCVKGDISAQCDDAELKKADNSGAPVKITAFEELGSTKNAQGGIDINFKFKIAQTGSGKYKIYAPKPCSELKATDSNVVEISSMQFLGKEQLRGTDGKLACNQNPVLLDSDSGESDYVFCKITVPSGGSFEDTIKFNLKYQIKQSVKKEVQLIPI